VGATIEARQGVGKNGHGLIAGEFRERSPDGGLLSAAVSDGAVIPHAQRLVAQAAHSGVAAAASQVGRPGDVELLGSVPVTDAFERSQRDR
jgi:hypothetical protein